MSAKKLKTALGLAFIGVASALSLSTLQPSNNLTRHIQENPRILSRVDENITKKFISRYKGEILSAALRHNVPPELIAATLENENLNRVLLDDLTDLIGTYIGKDVSLGVGQIRISTARNLHKQHGEDLTRVELVDRLNDSLKNIEEIAMFYEAEMQSMGIRNPNEVIYNPERIVDLASRYVGGIKPSQEARIAALGTLISLSSPRIISLYRSNSDATKIASAADNYLLKNKKTAQEVGVNKI